MWKCELCGKEFNDETMAVEVRFGYVDSEESINKGNQYDGFFTESAIAPICDDCAITYIKGEKINETKI
jgi:ribosome-binding protein aMBF1 (putative translation factor)